LTTPTAPAAIIIQVQQLAGAVFASASRQVRPRLELTKNRFHTERIEVRAR
jgi:hypothetical protein